MPHLSEVMRALRDAFTREALPPPPPPAAPAAAPSPGLLRRLFAQEPLPVDPEPPRARRRSLLATVFAREALPADPAPAAASARSPWLRWLFAAERLDPPSPRSEEE